MPSKLSHFICEVPSTSGSKDKVGSGGDTTPTRNENSSPFPLALPVIALI